MTPRRPPRGLAPGLAWWAVLAAVAALYWPGLHGPLVLDDLAFLEPLTRIDSWGGVAYLLVDPALPWPGRRLARASFAVDQLVSGGAVWQLKYVNLMLHLLTGTLVFWLAGRLLAAPAVAPAPGDGQRRWWLALWIAAAWLAAPLLVSTVLYVVQRLAILAALLTVAGLLAYVIGRQRMAERPRQGWALVAAAFLVFWPLATLAKENGALLPLLALVLEVFFLRFQGSAATRRALHGLFLVTVALPVLAFAAHVAMNPGWLVGGYAHREFTLAERLLTQPRVLTDYALNLLGLPGGGPLSLYRDDVALSRSLLEPPATLAALAFWLALPVAAWLARRRPWGPVLGGGVFFLAALSLESSVIALEIQFEHRAYLPGVGLFLGAGLGLALLFRTAGRPRLLAAVLAGVLVMYAGQTLLRVQTWRSWEGILEAAAETRPESFRVQVGLANLRIVQGDAAAALAAMERAADLAAGRPRAPAVALQHLSILCRVERPAPEPVYRRLEAAPLPNQPYATDALRWLVQAAEATACPGIDLARAAAALEASAGSLRGTDRRWHYHHLMARLHRQAGNPVAAARHGARAAELLEMATAPRRPLPY